MGRTLTKEEEQLVSHLRAAAKRPLMWMPRGTYDEFCALVTGIEVGSGTTMLKEFQQWLGERNPDYKNYVHYCLVLVEMGYHPRPGWPNLSAEESAPVSARFISLLDEFLGR